MLQAFYAEHTKAMDWRLCRGLILHLELLMRLFVVGGMYINLRLIARMYGDIKSTALVTSITRVILAHHSSSCY